MKCPKCDLGVLAYTWEEKKTRQAPIDYNGRIDYAGEIDHGCYDSETVGVPWLECLECGQRCASGTDDRRIRWASTEGHCRNGDCPNHGFIFWCDGCDTWLCHACYTEHNEKSPKGATA